MKNWILSIGLLLSLSNSQAQYFNFISHYEDLSKYHTIDSAYLKCIYQLTYLKDSLKPEEKSFDLQVLLIGTTISSYYSQYALDYNHFVVDYLKKGHDTYPGIREKGAWRYELFKNYPRGKETVTDIASMLQGNFIYEEDPPVFDWKIMNENQTILSYNCQKATVSFRGRDYIAWFTTDIPIPNGPWKFGGLPGLILKIQDSKNNFRFECNGLEQLNPKESIRFYQVDYTKITRKDLAKTYQRFHDDMVAYMKIRERQVHVMSGGNTFKIPYNPIELE
jgi:GLPGLI family protein